MNTICYHSGYKYQLCKTYRLLIPLFPRSAVESEYVSLFESGLLSIKRGYAWDGPSGPTFDTRNFMRGSLVHDALYQLMRAGLLSSAEHREAADKLLQQLCREDGMSKLRAWWVYKGVRLAGNKHTLRSDPEIHYAP